MLSGLLLNTRRFYPDGGRVAQPSRPVSPFQVDLLCRNTSGGTLSGDAVAGCDAVDIDFANLVVGRCPPVKKPGTTQPAPVLGVVAEGQGTIAANAEFWVRVKGWHDYALVDGTTDVAAGNALQGHSSTAGALQLMSGASSQLAARAREAYTTNSIAVKKVILNDPSNVLCGG